MHGFRRRFHATLEMGMLVKLTQNGKGAAVKHKNAVTVSKEDRPRLVFKV